jgi:cell wall-associated NlpC family hydrolase
LPGETLGKEKHGIINVSVANLRSLPKHSAELVTQAILGTPVALLKKTDGWYLVQTPDQYIAWTNDASLVSMDEEQFNEWGKDEKIIYLDTYGFSYSNEDNHRVSDLVAGSILRLEQENHDFWQILYPDGRKAKISKNEAKNFQSWYSEIEVSDQSITSAAEDLMGVPYLWGGTSTKGVDCSGFTKTVYFLQGLVLPRDASQQAAVGELIDTSKEFSKLIIGDLLFFGKINEDQTEHVVHVGLWLGNNKYIHASGDVHISSMDPLDENFDQYNYNRYLRSKRIIGTPQISVKNVLTSD